MSDQMYPPNSFKHREEQKRAAAEEKRITKVAKGPVKTKKNEARKLANVFISEDVKNVRDHIFLDVVVPAVKKVVYDIITNGIDMILYGGTGKGKSNSNGVRVSYQGFYDQKRNAPGSQNRVADNSRSASKLDYEDLVFSNRGDAELVKQQMQDVIGRYGVVTISDMYEMADPNLTPPFTGHKYGWMDVSSAYADRVRDGYVLKLPRAVPID